MTTTLELPPLANAKRTVTTDVPAVASARTSGKSANVRIPLFVPREQVYYWTQEWQAGEAEALSDIEAGRLRRFSSGVDAANWLLADED